MNNKKKISIIEELSSFRGLLVVHQLTKNDYRLPLAPKEAYSITF